jgi:hypothetical protein
LQFAAFAGVLDALLHVAHAVEILVEFPLVAGADVASQVLGIGQNGIEHALVGWRSFVFEETIKGQCG